MVFPQIPNYSSAHRSAILSGLQKRLEAEQIPILLPEFGEEVLYLEDTLILKLQVMKSVLFYMIR